MTRVYRTEYQTGEDARERELQRSEEGLLQTLSSVLITICTCRSYPELRNKLTGLEGLLVEAYIGSRKVPLSNSLEQKNSIQGISVEIIRRILVIGKKN